MPTVLIFLFFTESWIGLFPSSLAVLLLACALIWFNRKKIAVFWSAWRGWWRKPMLGNQDPLSPKISSTSAQNFKKGTAIRDFVLVCLSFFAGFGAHAFWQMKQLQSDVSLPVRSLEQVLFTAKHSATEFSSRIGGKRWELTFCPLPRTNFQAGEMFEWINFKQLEGCKKVTEFKAITDPITGDRIKFPIEEEIASGKP